MEAGQIIKGSLAAIVLKLLEDNGRMYGYEMTKSVRDLTKGKMAITEAALYPTLHKLVERGILTTEMEKIEGRMRKYYSLTKKGKKEKNEQVAALKDALESIQLILNPKLHNG